MVHKNLPKFSQKRLHEHWNRHQMLSQHLECCHSIWNVVTTSGMLLSQHLECCHNIWNVVTTSGMLSQHLVFLFSQNSYFEWRKQNHRKGRNLELTEQLYKSPVRAKSYVSLVFKLQLHRGTQN